MIFECQIIFFSLGGKRYKSRTWHRYLHNLFTYTFILMWNVKHKLWWVYEFMFPKYSKDIFINWIQSIIRTQKLDWGKLLWLRIIGMDENCHKKYYKRKIRIFLTKIHIFCSLVLSSSILVDWNQLVDIFKFTSHFANSNLNKIS